MFVAPLAGFLSDRFPAGILGGIGMAVSILALVLLAFMPADPGFFDIAWRMALCGSGFGLFTPPNARLIVGSAPRDRAAAAGGLVSTVRLAGQTTGATVVAALLAFGVGEGRMPPMVAAGLAAVAGLCSIARLRPSIRNPRPEEAEYVQAEVTYALAISALRVPKASGAPFSSAKQAALNAARSFVPENGDPFRWGGYFVPSTITSSGFTTLSFLRTSSSTMSGSAWPRIQQVNAVSSARRGACRAWLARHRA